MTLFYGVTKSLKVVKVRTRGPYNRPVSKPMERARLANQIQIFRIPDRREAGVKEIVLQIVSASRCSQAVRIVY